MKTKHLNPVCLLFLQTTNIKPEVLHNYKESPFSRYLLCLKYLLCQYKILISSNYLFLIIRIIRWPPKIITWGNITKYPLRGMLASLKRIFLYFLEKRDIMRHVFYGADDVEWIVLWKMSAMSLEVLKEKLGNHLSGIPPCLLEVRITEVKNPSTLCTPTSLWILVRIPLKFASLNIRSFMVWWCFYAMLGGTNWS